MKCEMSLRKKLNGAKSINIPFDQKELNEECVNCRNGADFYAYFGKSY